METITDSVDFDQLSNDDSYVKIRCRGTRLNKTTGKRFTCSRVCAEVIVPAKGRAYCPSCKLKFNYDVSTASRFNVETFIVAKPVDNSSSAIS